MSQPRFGNYSIPTLSEIRRQPDEGQSSNGALSYAFITNSEVRGIQSKTTKIQGPTFGEIFQTKISGGALPDFFNKHFAA